MFACRRRDRRPMLNLFVLMSLSALAQLTAGSTSNVSNTGSNASELDAMSTTQRALNVTDRPTVLLATLNGNTTDNGNKSSGNSSATAGLPNQRGTVAGPHNNRTSENGTRLTRRAPPGTKSASQSIVTTADILNNDERGRYVMLHNAVRSAVIPPAADMSFVVWDGELEKAAVKLAFKCLYETRGRTTADFFDLRALDYHGQLLWYNDTEGHVPDRNERPLPDKVVQTWWSTALNYDFMSNQCAEGQNCMSYKQLVYSWTTRIACGMSWCDKISGVDATGWFVTCLYKDGILGFGRPYRAGPSCRLCSYLNCNKNLCTMKNPCGGVQDCTRNLDESSLCLCEEAVYLSILSSATSYHYHTATTWIILTTVIAILLT